MFQFDESDIKNESYICFRRRDTKAIRKTRAAQISSADKLSRLRTEIGQAMELARNVMAREVHKKEAYLEARSVWERRQAFVDLKRKFPTLGGREEEDLLFDKERIPKKPKPVVEAAQIAPPAAHTCPKSGGRFLTPFPRYVHALYGQFGYDWAVAAS